MDIIALAAANTGLPLPSVRAAAALLAKGNTVPFISRYRKEVTGNLDEVAVRAVETEIARLTSLSERRKAIADALEGQGNLSEDIKARLESATTMSALEDIYLPFRPKRRTRATIARERGLEPLARMLMSAAGLTNPESAASRFVKGDVADTGQALAGACDIVAEWVSESPRARNSLRGRFRREAMISSTVVKGKEADAATFRNYASFTHRLGNIASHQYLALRRGEAEGLLKLSVTINDSDAVDSILSWFVPRNSAPGSRKLIASAVADGYRRLLRPSIETEMSGEWKEKADAAAISLFSDNLRQLLLAAPLRGRRIVAIDPGFRTGCKVVALDPGGALL
ncbi:MAG: RNA-binding transcriptional accessory protein, partial [Muribaculaceae bacterium]|nr:RNA-binding transcriptional accessory protein [Muribaculaceae bacterium]